MRETSAALVCGMTGSRLVSSSVPSRSWGG